MADEDIYGSKVKYEQFKASIDNLKNKPKAGGKQIYYCRNPKNVIYFNQLCKHFEANDTSYIRRMRLFQSLKFIVYHTTKDLAKCEREDIDSILIEAHKVHKTVQSKSSFIKEIKFIWRKLFPELDKKGRPDETITPYPVRHVSNKIDKSKNRLRGDKLVFEEFERILNYFASDPRMQAYLMLAFESLGRPQEILYVKIKDLEISDNYAKVWITDHGKEGPGFLQCIDSFPYVIKWYNQHPFKKDPEAFLFINTGKKKRSEQLKPTNVNKLIRNACKHLGIEKPVTCYSLKRNGVTFRRLRGDNDMEIQHAARWTSSKQLKTYDMSDQDDAFKIELVKRGLLKDSKHKELQPKVKECLFCGERTGFSDDICPNCKRPLDREKLKEGFNDYEDLRKDVSELKESLKKRERYEKIVAEFLRSAEGKERFDEFLEDNTDEKT